MKQFCKLTFLFISWLSTSIAVQAQESPCLCVGTESRTCTTHSSATATTPFPIASRNVSLEISDSPTSLDTFEGARYKAFWIFGDGNFAYFPHREFSLDNRTLRQEYVYRRSGRYTTEAVLSEKKSNTRPPVRDRRIIQVGGNLIPGTTGTPFVQQLSGNAKTADVLPSDSMRPHEYLTAFAVSAPKSPSNSGIYFFYNSKVDAGSIIAAAMHEFVDVDLPDYAGTTVLQGLTSALANPIGDAVKRQFNNYIFVPITSTNFGSMPADADFTEYRIFPILKTIWTSSLPKCRFLAVIVGNQSIATSDKEIKDGRVLPETTARVSFFTAEKLAELERLNRNYFDGRGLNSAFYIDSTQTEVYVRGMYEVDVPMVGSIDPNELEVVSICPLEAGKYLVKMRVQVCNRGIIPVSNIPIRLIDHSQGLFSDFAFLTDSATLTPTLTFDSGTHTWRFVHGGLNGVSTPEDLGSNSRSTPYEPKCLEVYFTLKTNLAGVKKLFSSNPLESCATFPGSNFPDECHFNFPVDSTKFTPKYGYNCGGGGSVPPTNCCCGMICFLLIAVILAILLWWFLKKND